MEGHMKAKSILCAAIAASAALVAKADEEAKGGLQDVGSDSRTMLAGGGRAELVFSAMNASDAAADRTAELQHAIDAVSRAGGGTVRLTGGDYPVRQLFLKDGVTLLLDDGATLLGSTNRGDYVQRPLKGSDFRWPAVLCADKAKDIALRGKGKIDGRGWAVGPHDKSAGRWRDVLFYRCRNVLVEDVSLVNPASWTFYLKECEKVVVRRVTINSPWAWNNDGLDIDAKDVLVEDCVIDSDDDALCLKSDNPDFLCENVEVRNCRLASCCNHIKLGTASHGGFRNIDIHDCRLVACATNIIPQVKFANDRRTGRKPLPGVDEKDVLSRIGIAVECVDGGLVDNVRIHDITMTRCVQTPVFVRLGRRRERPGVKSSLQNVLIENVTGEAASHIASSITGVPGLRPHGITLRNCAFTVKGGAKLADCGGPVIEAEKAYPENQMFDRHMLPAYGFYVRHADGVRFENVQVKCATPDERPPLAVDDCTSVTASGCSFSSP